MMHFDDPIDMMFFKIPISVDTAESSDIILRGPDFELVSKKNECHVMQFQPMKITKISSNIMFSYLKKVIDNVLILILIKDGISSNISINVQCT